MNNEIILQNALVPVNSLDAYIQRVERIPMLSQEEEIELANDLIENQNLESAQKLIMAHLKYVVRIAKGYVGYGLPLSDLIQEGAIGLMKAVKKFDTSHKVRLVSFAVHWIKAEIHEYVIKNWKIVKVATTKAQRKLFFNLRSMKKRLGWFTKSEVETVARDLGVSEEEVLRMEQRLNSNDIAFDLPNDASSENQNLLAPAEYIADENSDPYEIVATSAWNKLNNSLLRKAFEQLDERSKDILHKRWFKEKKETLQELAALYDISPERVRQLEKQAIEKLKALISK